MQATQNTQYKTAVEHFDVLVVGAGISGIGAAWHLQTQSPGTTYAVLESKPTFGGTWVTHTYPGIRSDSDLYTFGYRFKPWSGAPIATAEEILNYMGEVIQENGLAPHIRYGHAILSASWSTAQRRWALQVRQEATGQVVQMTAGFLWMCQGYYDHHKGYTPEWPGMQDFTGRIVHPQNWPQDLDYADKRVVVIGSGATAATLLPAMAAHCAHITMLQRSPTYFRTARNVNELADMLRQLQIPEEWTHEIVRRKILLDQTQFQVRALAEPDAVKRDLLNNVRSFLGDKVDVDKHFSPNYRPWQQRVAFIPDGDLFQAIAKGQASVVTDDIDTFTPSGIRLKSGTELPVDIIVTATGFNLCALGGIAFEVDGKPLDFGNTVSYRGAMFTGVPNMVWVFGYFRWSWTLRVDVLGDFVCRLLAQMKTRGSTMVTPELRSQDQGMALKAWIEPDNFNPGYLARGVHLMPKQGVVEPWRHDQDYIKDLRELPLADLDDGALRFK